MTSFGRHNVCKEAQPTTFRKATVVPRHNTAAVQLDTKKQIAELTENLKELKTELALCSDRIKEQANVVVEQGLKNQEISKDLAYLKIEIGSKNNQIIEQTVVLEKQQQQILELTQTVNELKTDVASKFEQIYVKAADCGTLLQK